jgi:hypothetical protein
MTKLRQVELLISLFLNSKQKFLLNFHKRHLIQLEKKGRKKFEDSGPSTPSPLYSSSSSEIDEKSHQIFQKLPSERTFIH